MPKFLARPEDEVVELAAVAGLFWVPAFGSDPVWPFCPDVTVVDFPPKNKKYKPTHTIRSRATTIIDRTVRDFIGLEY